MKYILFAIIVLYGTVVFSQQKVFVITGTYQGENLIIDNPFTSTGLGYCVSEIRVNGKLSTDEINSSSFEIDLSAFDLKIGAQVTISIKHKDGCEPKAVNPTVLEARSTFETESITVDLNGNLSWVTTGESGKLEFSIEQYKWNKWVNVGKVAGIGTPNKNTYTAKVTLHSGANRFRVKQMDFSRKPRYSDEAKINNLRMQPVEFKRKGNKIIFTAETFYELYDPFGQLKMKGKGIELDITKLDKGQYQLIYDNALGEFEK